MREYKDMTPTEKDELLARFVRARDAGGIYTLGLESLSLDEALAGYQRRIEEARGNT